MKRSKKILASLLCAAMLCIPTLAAGEQDAPGAGAYVPDPQSGVPSPGRTTAACWGRSPVRRSPPTALFSGRKTP